MVILFIALLNQGLRLLPVLPYLCHECFACDSLGIVIIG
jgi:hypothetical protein